MKKALFVLLFFAISFSLFANSISPELAANIAKNFYKSISKEQKNVDITASLAFIEKSSIISIGSIAMETSLFYIFNINLNEGYVIVSADDDVIPILGYSITGNFSGDNLPPALSEMFENYKAQINYIILHNLKANDELRGKWARLKNGETLNPGKDLTSVNPLITTTWNQSPYVNAMCPYDNTYNQLTVTGCTATAMAQIMKYWNWPVNGTGFHSYEHPVYGTQSANFAATTYNWAAMPNNVTSTNTSVATLMYHCGVGVDMNYGVGATGGSSSYIIDDNGANPACAENAYKTYFGYNPTTIQGLKRINYANSSWINLLKTDLNNSRPIQYAGFGSAGGHTFVCDGYDNNDFFHMNWGWGGNYNGFYNLDQLNPGSSGFNDGQQAVIGIQPLIGGSSSNIDMYSSITITPNPIDFYQSFEVNADVINSGTSNFNGDYCAALFNSEGLFIDFVSILTTGSNPLPPGYHYTGGITFTNIGMPAVPGNYIIGIYYMDPGGEWQLAGNTNFTNPVNTSVSSPYNPLEQYSDIVVTPSELVQGQPASVNVNLYNTNNYTYFGQYQAALYDLSGNFIQTIGILNEVDGLPSGYTYAVPYLTFTTNSITAEPGTYMLAILEKENGYPDWYFVGGTYYLTPINVNVVEAPLALDVYEPNNSEGSSYNLPLSFSGNTAIRNTVGSNIHTGEDQDYYQIYLAAGYEYSISARVHDSYNSGNGQTYTCDAMFSYKFGTEWSETFDDIMTSPIIVIDGGTVFFHVTPYFAGQTGTYLLDMTITRTILAPAPAGAISGPTDVCLGQSNVTYSVPGIANATTYIWTLPSGASGNSSTNSINVSFGSAATSGNISVYGNNSYGNGTSSSLMITINSMPSNAGPIYGSSTICQGLNGVIYTVPVIVGATSYIWTLPTGAAGSSNTNSISVNYSNNSVSGNINVMGSNSCGNGVFSELPIQVNTKPSTPLISLNGNVLYSDASVGNQWYNQNGIINGATGQNYTTPISGNYFSIVTLTGCSSDPSNTINVVITGMESLVNNNKVHVYPNPFSDELILEKKGNNLKLNFEIINSIGKLVAEGSLIEKAYVETTKFPRGVYLIKLKDNNSFECRKIIKE